MNNRAQRTALQAVSVVTFSLLGSHGFVAIAQQQEIDLQPVCPVPSSLITLGGLRPTSVSENYRQQYTFSGGESYLQISRHERENAASEWESQEFLYSTDIRITDVGFCGGGSSFYVAGMRFVGGVCQDVIEKWTINLPRGAYTMKCNSSPAPRGTAMPTPFNEQLSTTVVGGGDFVPISERNPRQPAVRKTVIFASSSSEIISAIEADPEGRFLIVQSHQSGSVYSLDLTTPQPVLVLEFSASQYPQLTKTNIIVAYEHTTEGRVYAFSEGSKHNGLVPLGARYIFASDTDNDGIFDSIQDLDTAEFIAGPFYQPPPVQFSSQHRRGIPVRLMRLPAER